MEAMVQREQRNKQLFAFLDDLRAWDWNDEDEEDDDDEYLDEEDGSDEDEDEEDSEEDDEEDDEEEDDEDDEDEDEGEEDEGPSATPEEIKLVLAWTEEQWAMALKALRKPSTDDFDLITQLALGHGGLPYLRDRRVSSASIHVLLLRRAD